jgi:hypothetical protein
LLAGGSKYLWVEQQQQANGSQTCRRVGRALTSRCCADYEIGKAGAAAALVIKQFVLSQVSATHDAAMCMLPAGAGVLLLFRCVSVAALRSGLSTFKHKIFFGGGQTSLHTMCLTHHACFLFACCL